MSHLALCLKCLVDPFVACLCLVGDKSLLAAFATAMHFWIDKRSQQCGFGRSRVAASLSHAGSYGHPPRRSKSSNSSHSLALPPVHSTSNSRHYINNNVAHTSSHVMQSNNNNSSGGIFMNNTTASNNNSTNSSSTTSSAAVLTGTGAIVPVATRSHYHSSRYQPRQQLQVQQHQPQLLHHQQHHHYSYHHPQFGNMAVRHYQSENHHNEPTQPHRQQHAAVYADDAYNTYHSNIRQSEAYATPRRHNSSSNMRHATTTAPASTTTTTTTVTAVPSSQTARGSNNLQQQHQALLQHADSQLLPSHLKCGMCASLVLASVFVAGAKFYFDHQGTGLEVLIFCAFSATFFLAACTVSLCRIPKGLMPGRSDRRGACHNRANAARSAASNVNSSCMVGLELGDVRYLDERAATASAATDSAAAASGPPPYHIAILLPEQSSAALAKHVAMDESPPPSYDKILI